MVANTPDPYLKKIDQKVKYKKTPMTPHEQRAFLCSLIVGFALGKHFIND